MLDMFGSESPDADDLPAAGLVSHSPRRADDDPEDEALDDDLDDDLDEDLDDDLDDDDDDDDDEDEDLDEDEDDDDDLDDNDEAELGSAERGAGGDAS